MLLKPGEIPQSTTAVIPFSTASSSSRNGSSGKKEISTTFFPASIIDFKELNPINPGSAPITRSWPSITLIISESDERSA